MNAYVAATKNNQAYFEDFITRSTYNSNSIEGNTLSYAETYAIIFNDNSLKVTAEPREFYEAVNHKYALSYLFENIGKELSEAFIIDIAKIINKNINEISGYRTTQIFIRGAEHIPPLPNMIKQQMMYFIHNYNSTLFTSTFEKAAAMHIEFERLHPFSDGNGRTGRILINYELIKSNYAPAVILKDSRNEYMELLAKQDVIQLALFIESLSNNECIRMSQFVENEKSLYLKNNIASNALSDACIEASEDYDMEL